MSRTREKPWWISDVRPHGNRWRFSTGGAGKAKDDYYSFPTEAEALKLRALFIADRDAQAAATFGETLARYAEHKAGKRKNKSATVTAYETRTGLCSDCDGSKRTAAGWSAGTGTRYETCARCKGDGKSHLTGAPEPVPAAPPAGPVQLALVG